MRFETLTFSLRDEENTSFNRVWSWTLFVPAIIMSICIIKPYWLKACTHGAICIRVQILHICKICIRMQIAPCVRIYSRMQNLHVCKSWKICTWLRPSANLILRICKFCIYANLVM